MAAWGFLHVCVYIMSQWLFYLCMCVCAGCVCLDRGGSSSGTIYCPLTHISPPRAHFPFIVRILIFSSILLFFHPSAAWLSFLSFPSAVILCLFFLVLVSSVSSSSPYCLSVFLIIMRDKGIWFSFFRHSCQPCYRRELISHLIHALIKRGWEWGMIGVGYSHIYKVKD